MPNAVPFESGIIGLYNNSTSPGVYVAWDSNTNFNSTFSLIFRGYQDLDYRFPLIINSYNNLSLLLPISLGQGQSITYVLNSSGIIIAYQKVADTLKYIASINATASHSGTVPDKICVVNVGGIDYIFSVFGQSIKNFDVYYFANNQFNFINTYSNGSFPTSNWTTYDFSVTPSGIYFGNNSLIYQSTYSISTSALTITSTNTLNFSFSATIKKIAIFSNDKFAILDTNNVIYEYLNEGVVGVGNTSGYQWNLNFSISPTTQIYQSMIYNHFGLIICTDGANDQVVLIGGQNITTKTQTYGSFDGFTYQIVDTSTNTTFQGNILNTIGGSGNSYLQFDNPICVVEDSEFNLIIGDYNNRLTYFPTQLDFVGLVSAPLSEYIDSAGNPSSIYYVKQSNIDFTSCFSIPPLYGDELLIKSSVLYELNALLRIPVYDEEPLFGYLRQSATLAYGDIVTDPAPQVRITCSTNNGQRSSMFVLSPYSGFTNSLDQSESDVFSAPTISLNYPNGLFYRFTNEGKLYFFDTYGNPVSIQEYDTILVTYYVKLFTNKQINNALYLALQAINAQPGLNKISTVKACPFYYDQTLVSGATYYLLRQLAVGLNSRERRLLVQDSEQGSFDAVANIKDTAKMYQEEFGELLKKLPINQRPMMGTITVPEFSAPGSRSRVFRALWKGGAS
jgi:hypothetical protein